MSAKYEPRAHYWRFVDEVGALQDTLAEAIAAAEAMRDARDPVHRDRSDMGASVWLVEGDRSECVWDDGGYVS